ncbi:MAG: hypothetical protein ABIG71_01050 [Candidatus Uhrbacteria bacterium]
MNVHIDTSGERGKVALRDPRTTEWAARKFALGRLRRPGALLWALRQLLDRRGQPIEKIREVGVVGGPGSYSDIRLGVVTANALAWSLRVPLHCNGVRVRVAKPEYDTEPKITELKRNVDNKR